MGLQARSSVCWAGVSDFTSDMRSQRRTKRPNGFPLRLKEFGPSLPHVSARQSFAVGKVKSCTPQVQGFAERSSGSFRTMAAIWAHRGASALERENTFDAFRVAKALGADGVELDVRRSRDAAL